MRLLIVGTGTIGEPLIKLFLAVRHLLNIQEVIYHKNEPEEKCRGMLMSFHADGAKLAVYRERYVEFEKLLAPKGLKPDYIFDEAIEKADIIIDCTDKGIARKLKEKYYLPLVDKKLGFIAQGSENGFGIPYAYDINDQALKAGEHKFIQVVSCNTHQVLRLLKTLAFDPDQRGIWEFDNLLKAVIYLARRDADISQDEMTIGPSVGKPTDPQYGSHQAVDAARVLGTITKNKLPIRTTADTYNQPFMHVVNFDITLKEKLTLKEAQSRFEHDRLVAVTFEPRVHRVFSRGRVHGHCGRILNQTVVYIPSLEIVGEGNEVIGRCFTPQDGNALLSSVAAMLWLKYPEKYKQIMRTHFYKLPFLFDEI